MHDHFITDEQFAERTAAFSAEAAARGYPRLVEYGHTGGLTQSGQLDYRNEARKFVNAIRDKAYDEKRELTKSGIERADRGQASVFAGSRCTSPTVRAVTHGLLTVLANGGRSRTRGVR